MNSKNCSLQRKLINRNKNRLKITELNDLTLPQLYIFGGEKERWN